ncbi:pyridoxal phosphate-dependent aminotransferase family protein [Dactylosporangium sp. NPDC000555]|uniref:aminotransferase class I/II-fold pyridoxal phosphate-dependent enzyme n=1 Tax=Dactylosporangium sp. NPDC000555 TaxID=3154260 RepID=UPI00331EB4B5
MTVHPLHSTNGTYVRRDGRWGDLERLRTTSPMYDATIEEIDGRRIRVGSHWLTDWASCNYLGFDLEPEIMDSVDPYVRTWGTHPSWSRLLGNPKPYIEIEERLTELLGAPDTLLLPTITHIHMSVIPVLAADGMIFLDSQSHKTIYDGCMYAKGLGATVQRFRANDPEHLAELLAAAPAGVAKLVAMDGVNSMTGLAPDLARFAAVCRQYDALLYVDDAHGFGVIGERRADETSPYGSRGNAVVRHAGETYDNVVLVGGFSKAYSSLMAFLALPTWLKNHLKVAAPPYLYSGPSPTASLATVMAGLDLNEKRGEEIRADLYRKTVRVLDHVRSLGLHTPNTGTTPIIELPLAAGQDIAEVGQFLWDREVYVTLAAYPLVPRDQVGFRIQVTAANTDEEIDRLNAVLSELAGADRLRDAA